MQPGELRNRIEIQRLTKTQGIYGDTKISFLPLKKVWAKVNGLHGKEYWEAKEYGVERTVEFVIRYSACRDLTEKDRILFRGNFYNISSIDNVMYRNEYLKIKAVADITERGNQDGTKPERLGQGI